MWPGRPRVVQGEAPIDARYRAILGSNLRAFWHASAGVSFVSGNYVASWTDRIAGYALTATPTATSPSLAVDGAHFGGKPVVQFAAGGRQLLASTPGLVAAGGRPYLFAVWRFRDTAGTYPYVVSLPNDLAVIYATGAGQPERGYVTANGAGIAIDSAVNMETAQHFSEVWLDGTSARFSHDGVETTAASTGVVTAAIDSVQVARAGEGNVSVMMVGVCTVAPSAAERAALSALIASDCGSPRTILGTTLAEYWHAAQGTSLTGGKVSVWAGQKAGMSLAQSVDAQRPGYGVSAGAFGGRSVVLAEDKILLAPPGSPTLYAAGSKPYLAAWVQFGALPPGFVNVCQCADQAVSQNAPGLYRDATTLQSWCSSGPASIASTSTAPLFAEAYYDTSNTAIAVDGGAPVLAAGGALAAAVDLVQIKYGRYALIAVGKSVPSAVQRAALQAYARAQFPP